MGCECNNGAIVLTSRNRPRASGVGLYAVNKPKDDPSRMVVFQAAGKNIIKIKQDLPRCKEIIATEQNLRDNHLNEDKAHAAECILKYIPNGFAVLLSENKKKLDEILDRAAKRRFEKERRGKLYHDHADNFVLGTIGYRGKILLREQDRFLEFTYHVRRIEQMEYLQHFQGCFILLPVIENKLMLPGGKRELGETTEDCVERETEEETSIFGLWQYLEREDRRLHDGSNQYFTFIVSCLANDE